MERLRTAALVLGAWLVAGLGIYELTAKSPLLGLGAPPGSRFAALAEAATRWQPPTGLLPVDKLLHEGEEAARFYAALAGFPPRTGAQLR